MCVFFFFKQKRAYELRISAWISALGSSDLLWQTKSKAGAENGACDPIVPLTARKQQGKGSRMSMNRPEIVVIMARADNGVIGREGKMPWHLPADLRRFKSLTQGTPMIMGRKTFDSLPGLRSEEHPTELQ